MKKKLFAALLAVLLPILSLSGFAARIELNLLEGGISVLDGIFLIGAGILLVGIILVCIAVLTKKKSENSVDEIEEPTASEPEALAEEPNQEEPQAEDAEPEKPAEEQSEAPAPSESEPKTAEQVPAEPEKSESVSQLTLTGVNNEERWTVSLTDSVTIGRRTGCDLVLSDNTVSGSHCRIFREDNTVYIEDLNSTNGTYLDGTEVTEKTPLPQDAEIRLGQQQYKVNY